MNEIKEFIDIRIKFLSKYLDGLIHSKKKCEKEWTEQDEKELLMLKGRKRELDSVLNKIKDKRGLSFYVKREQDKINRMNEFSKNKDEQKNGKM